MSNESSKPEEAAAMRARWADDVEAVRRRLVGDLANRGVDVRRLDWLTANESEQIVQHWIELGAQRYGSLAFNPPEGSNARRGEFEDGTVPSWLNAIAREVLVLFFRPSRGNLLARCSFEFVAGHLSAFARTDGDGFGAIGRDLEGVLLVNVEESLGASTLDIDAWGEFVTEGL